MNKTVIQTTYLDFSIGLIVKNGLSKDVLSTQLRMSLGNSIDKLNLSVLKSIWPKTNPLMYCLRFRSYLPSMVLV